MGGEFYVVTAYLLTATVVKYGVTARGVENRIRQYETSRANPWTSPLQAKLLMSMPYVDLDEAYAVERAIKVRARKLPKYPVHVGRPVALRLPYPRYTNKAVPSGEWLMSGALRREEAFGDFLALALSALSSSSDECHARAYEAFLSKAMELGTDIGVDHSNERGYTLKRKVGSVHV